MGLYISGAMGGSGLSPTVLSYSGDATLVELTTANAVDRHILPILSIGDIVFATVEIGTVNLDGRIVVVEAVDASAGTSTLTPWETYAGDTRATDEAGYVASNFSGNIGAGAAPRLFTYRNNTDLIATITADGYFDELIEVLTADDIILVIGNDGTTILTVTGVDTGTVVTVGHVITPVA